MTRFIVFAITLLTFLPVSGFAGSAPRSLLTLPVLDAFDDPTSPSAVSALAEGIYQGTGTQSYFVGGQLTISKWAEEFIATARVRYGQTQPAWDYQVTLTHDKDNHFVGVGNISGKFTTGTTCYYQTRLEVFAYTDRVFVKEYSPTTLHSTLTSTGQCHPALEYSWFTHQDPYVRKP